VIKYDYVINTNEKKNECIKTKCKMIPKKSCIYEAPDRTLLKE